MNRVLLGASVVLVVVAGCTTTHKPSAPPLHVPHPATVVVPRPPDHSGPPTHAVPHPAPVAPSAPAAVRVLPPVAQPPRSPADGSRIAAFQPTLALAQSQAQAGNLDAAASTLERAARMAPQSSLVYQRLADVRVRQQRLTEATQLLRKAAALAITPAQAADVWQVLAGIEQRLGHAAAAADADTKAKALRP